jgi:hypothetical protein
MKITTLLWICSLSIVSAMQLRAANNSDDKPSAMTSIKVRLGEKTFTARLEDNATARAFTALLPLTVKMSDLNDNEKVIQLPEKLPGEVSNPGTIRTGDLMIWSSRSLVLFYKTFSTSYSYARLGRIEDPTGLAEAVGAGSVTVVFEKM